MMGTAGGIVFATSYLIFVLGYLSFPKFLRKLLASLWFNLTLHLVRSITNHAVHIVRKMDDVGRSSSERRVRV